MRQLQTKVHIFCHQKLASHDSDLKIWTLEWNCLISYSRPWLIIIVSYPLFCNKIIHAQCVPRNILNIQRVNYKVFSMTAQFGLWEEGRHDICYDVIYGRFYCWLFGDWDHLWCVSGTRTSPIYIALYPNYTFIQTPKQHFRFGICES